MISVVGKVIKAGHLVRKLARYISGKALGMTADLGFGTFKLRRPQLDWAIQALRSHHGESRASEARHVVLSTPKGTPRREAKKVIRAVWKDFISTYAPDRPWLFGLQFHNGILHGHGAISNVGSDGRPLDWKPHQVVAMSEMAFTEHAISAKGQGKKGLALYTKARGKMAVKDLAALVVDTGGNIKNEVWQRLKKKGEVSDFRNRQDGSLISFEFQGKRIRLATLKHFVERLQPDSGEDDSNSGSSSPPPSGLSSKDVKAINDVLQQASVPQARTPAKSKTRTRNAPK